jgi:hypothetical protein
MFRSIALKEIVDTFRTIFSKKFLAEKWSISKEGVYFV